MYMAMPSGNLVTPDKMLFPAGGVVMPAGGAVVPAGGVTGGGIGWYPDERDTFILWLRGEFAAANAIIDSMCQHLKSIGEVGEYDGVIGSVQQRRSNWNPVLHMQHYYSVAEVLNSLQQVTWRRQQQNRGAGFYDQGKGVGNGKEYKRSGSASVGFRQGQGPQNGANGSGNWVGIDGLKSDEKNGELVKYSDGLSTKPQVDKKAKSLDLQPTLSENLDCEVKEKSDSIGCTGEHLDNGLASVHTPQQKSNIAKTFVGNETLDGKTVNVVEGMKMYEELFDDSGVKKMVSLVNDLRSAGKRGEFQGHTFTVSKRPMKGHGREMIQFGVPIVDTLLDDEAIGATSKDWKIEPIPSLFQDFIERLMSMQVLTVKPDSCIIDIYNEGDHSQPHMWPHWFGRPVCVLSLTECDMTFGKVIGFDHPGDYRGAIKLSFTPGSMIVMEGKSADYAKHAIPSIRKQRILVTLTKSQPRRTTSSPSQWAPPPTRSPNQVGPKHYVQGSTTGVLPVRSSSNQPIFVPAAPMGGGWPSVPPLRQNTPSGTGVFLPPGSANSTAEKENDEKLEDCKESLDENDGKVAAKDTES